MNNDLINEIRNKTDIVDVVGKRIPLEKHGKNYFCVCPFHDDNNPSMSVSREKQIYSCFSCHATGNVFTFLMNYENITFNEAVKLLGDELGINTLGIKTKSGNNINQKLYDIMDFALRYFHNNINSKLGIDAKKYLHSRSINDDIINEYSIGLSLKDRDDLTKVLLKKKYDLIDLNKVGLTNDDYDIYNNRIMFPLHDLNGRVVGFSGRIYDGSNSNKYVNTKETPIFKKGNLLYNYHIAKEYVRSSNYLIIMEGFMDVVRAGTIGVKNTIALMGTALTSEQINIIKRLSKNITMVLDGDSAGKKAALTNSKLLVDKGLNVKVVTIPDNLDPDEFILKNGKDKFIDLLDRAVNYTEYKIKLLKDDTNFSNIDEKTSYINKILEEYSNIDDDIRLEISLKKLAKEVDISYNTLQMRLKDIKLNNSKPKYKEKAKLLVKSVRKNKYVKAIEEIIYLMLNNDYIITRVDNEQLILPDSKDRLLTSEISYFYSQNGYINVADFYTYISNNEKLVNYLNEIISCNYNDKIKDNDLDDYIKVIKEYSKKEEIKRLTNLINNESDPIKQAQLADKIVSIRMGE